MAAVASSILWVLVAITILVFVHEMGHFLAARLFGIRVDRFSIGFPPTIFKKKAGPTEWAIGALPLGGYVKIAGMIDESMDTEFAERPPDSTEFRAKPIWQRIVVICAGVIFNVILAIVIFSGLKALVGDPRPMTTDDGLVYVPDSSLAAIEVGLRTGDRILSVDGRPFAQVDGVREIPSLGDPIRWRVQREEREIVLEVPRDVIPTSRDQNDGGVFGLGIFNWPAVVGMVAEDGPAWEAGLRPGDRIAKVDQEPVALWLDFTQRIQSSDGSPLLVSWLRAETGEMIASLVTPEEVESGDSFRIGVQVAQKRSRYGLGEALVAGAAETWYFGGAIVTSLKNVIVGRESVRENLGGPVMVAQIAGQAAQAGAAPFWRLVAILSITLAIINILPIPALDGGHLIFLLYEGIVRREPSLKFRMVTQQAGMLLLIGLMAFLVYNDLVRIS